MLLINTVYDLINYAKENPKKRLCHYGCDWIIYDENGKVLDENEHKFNNRMMAYLEENLLTFAQYGMSTKSVKFYELGNLEEFYKNTQNIKNLYEDLLKKSKDKKFQSLADLKDFFDDYYHILVSNESYPGSYWGGSIKYQTMYFCNGNNIIDKFIYGMINNIKGDGFYNLINRKYNAIFYGNNI